MYDRILHKVMHTPWAIEPSKLAAIAELLRFRASGQRLTAEEIQARIGEGSERPQPSKQDGMVAIIPIFGVITHRANSFEAFSGGTSTELLGKYLRRAVADESVKAILLDICSPGGTIDGVPELAAEIAAAAKVKHVVATANAIAASAAYWLGSQASEFVVTPSGHVGSIGVYLVTEDLSEHLAKEGIKINAISAGDNKLEGMPWVPMSDETRAHLQARVDEIYAMFIRDVASGRRVSAATVKAEYGQGRAYGAKDALKRGMVDAIETLDQTIARLVKKQPKGYRSRTAASSSPGDVLATAATAPDDVATDLPAEIAQELPAAADPESMGAPTATSDGASVETAPAAAVPGAVAPAVDPAVLQADHDYMDAAIRIAQRR